MSLLVLDNLRKYFGGFAAVDGFSLSVERGALHAVIGPNGCGKSTLFNLITGGLLPSGGRVLFDGQNITGLSPYKIARLGIGCKFQVPLIFDELTVMENLLIPRCARLSDVDDMLCRIRLSNKAKQLAKNLSHGERQLLEMGMVFASQARLLLLDEPTAGMTVNETEQTADLIGEIVSEGHHTFIVIEHDMGFIKRLDCPVTVMTTGRPLVTGSFEDISANKKVQELYFGVNR